MKIERLFCINLPNEEVYHTFTEITSCDIFF